MKTCMLIVVYEGKGYTIHAEVRAIKLGWVEVRDVECSIIASNSKNAIPEKQKDVLKSRLKELLTDPFLINL